MTDHQNQAPQQQPPAVLHDGGRAGPLDADVTSDRPEEALSAIHAFTKSGKGSAKDIPQLISRLGVNQRKQLADSYPELSKRLPGATVLEVAEMLHITLHFAVEDAIDAKPPVDDGVLRAYLRGLDASKIAELDDNTRAIGKLRKHLPGPLGLALPVFADLPSELHARPHLIAWYLETAAPDEAALKLATSASSELVATIAKLGTWKWIDRIHIASDPSIGHNLRLYRAAAPADIQTKLDAMLAHHHEDADFEQGKAAARDELQERLEKADARPDPLLDAAARSGPAHDLEGDVAKRLRGESAHTIRQYASTARLPLAVSLPLLADKGAPEAVQAVLFDTITSDRLDALKDDKLRAAARRGLGRAVSLRSLILPSELGLITHDIVIVDEALRQWAYEDKEPTTLLWLAAGDSTQHQLSCDVVGRERGFAWVKQLSRTAPADDLHRFVLNCKDAAAVKHVTDHLLDQRPLVIDAARDDATPSDGAVHGTGTAVREQIAATTDKIPPHELLSRIADMTAQERRDLLADPTKLADVINKLADNEQLQRALFLLGPTIVQLLGMPLGTQPELLSYLRTRAAAEEAPALARADLVRRAQHMLPGVSPFLVFPTLRDPASLNAALANSEVLGWLLEGADADLVLTSLAHPAVRERAAAVLEQHAGLYKQLPLYKHLTKQGQASFEQLSEKMADEDAGARAEFFTEDTQPRTDPAAARGAKVADARRQGHLWDALEELRVGGDAAAFLGVVRAFPQDHVELLAGNHKLAVQLLAEKVKVPPQHVFPAIDILHLLGLPDARAWLLQSERAYLVLAQVAGNAEALKQLGTYLHGERDLAFEFIHSLPRGADLTPVETRAIDSLRLGFLDMLFLTAFFEIRFGSPLGPGFATPMDIHKLWNVLARLPPAQVNQEVIGHFRQDKDLGPNVDGFWDGKDVVLKDQMNPEDEMFERTPLLTAAEVKSNYGLEGAALAQATKKGGWIKQVGDKYQVRPVKHLDQFTDTVLHEVGHSVDTLLGNRTEVVFGAGGWRVHGIDQFDDWAREMNGFDKIPTGDAKRISDTWKQALRTGQKVSSMVDSDHPALDKKYAHSPLVQAAIDDHMFQYEQPLRGANGRIFTTGNNQGYLCSMPQSTADVAPSIYSTSAPEEFFAECYVEFYRGYDGTPATDANKGGHLAGWIKTWFAQNVDTVRLNPHRARKGIEDEAPAAAPNQSAKTGTGTAQPKP